MRLCRLMQLPTNITSCQPPLNQKVSIEAEVPVTVGMKVSEIVTLTPAASVAPLSGNPVPRKAPPITRELLELDTIWYRAP